ncbi:MAG: F0F1 ATP synthase subunit delta [Gammaproteobacteria bacterium]|nr:F0F1 ATP synthase subunit delta [Gammaproteobacteria bacterium]
MAEAATTARPYAQAAFAAARDGQALPAWSAFLGLASAVIGDARVRALIGNPRVVTAQLVDFLQELAGASGTAAQGNFLRLLAENRRLLLLPEIAAQYDVLRAAAEGRADVQVKTAMALDAAQEQRLVAALEQRLGRRVRLQVEIDARLIGGAIVRHGDLVFDGSLRGRLGRLAAAMTGT